MRDPFYQKILAGLEVKPFHPDLFEKCVCDLLRDAFPSLVPIPGGSDAGMDGAIADGEAEAFPLVCTTAKNVIRNLTRSLDRYLEEKRPRRKVSLATSQALTPKRRSNLEKRAKEKGFVLVQIIERQGIADRLYESPRWCRELLGLAGTPPALSTVPKSRRPLLEIPLIGREADIEWLRTTSGDRLLAGAPGSGKTHLLRQLVDEGWGLFLKSDNRTEIADALRELQPEVVIIDDAHANLAALETLRDLSREPGHRFDIVATSWTGSRDQVSEALGARPQIRELPLLTRDQILEVFEHAGLKNLPTQVLRHLVDQASNKPGLAATLAYLALRGEWKDLLSGEALARSTLSIFQNLVGEESAQLLAAVSLGGDSGMALEDVGEYLEFSRGVTHRLAVDLAAGGVLAETSSNGLSVHPQPLRSALLRRFFFSEATPNLPYRPLFEKTPDRAKATAAIVDAIHAGAQICKSELRELITQYANRSTWRAYARLGEAEAKWVLESYTQHTHLFPRELTDIADEVLAKAPRAAIPKLLDLAASWRSAGEKRYERALGPLSSWIEEITEFGPEEPLHRRRLLVRATTRFLKSRGDRQVGIEALLLALSPKLRRMSADPGAGSTVTLEQRLLSIEDLGTITDVFWPEILERLRPFDSAAWRAFRSALWPWTYPHAAAPGADLEEHLSAMKAFARRALRDLAAEARDRPGLAAALRRLAREVDLDLPIARDIFFELLYPDPSEVTQTPSGPREHVQAIRELAELWARTINAPEAAAILHRYHQEAQYLSFAPPRHLHRLCQSLAAQVDAPEAWFEAFLAEELPQPALVPFLDQAVEKRRPGWEILLTRSLETPSLRWAAMTLILRDPAPPRELYEQTLEALPSNLSVVQQAWAEAPPATQAQLLQHPDLNVALTAAIEAWNLSPAPMNPPTTPELHELWRKAILRSTEAPGCDDFYDTTEYWLGTILGKHPHLAFDWLAELLQRPDLERLSGESDVVGSALRALETGQRSRLIDQLSSERIPRQFLARLVGRNPELYRVFLAREDLREQHLEPLEGRPDEIWTELALEALNAGHEPAAIAAASFSGSHEWGGPSREYWARWEFAFQDLEEHPDPEMREVAKHGLRIARRRMEKGAAEDRRIELEGF